MRERCGDRKISTTRGDPTKYLSSQGNSEAKEAVRVRMGHVVCAHPEARRESAELNPSEELLKVCYFTQPCGSQLVGIVSMHNLLAKSKPGGREREDR